jgi:protein-disulfide isomerase
MSSRLACALVALLLLVAPAHAETDQERLLRLLYDDPESPVLGNPQGDVTVIEFFDYRCPYCRKAAPAVMALVAEDVGVRLVLKEWPILGPRSVEAARAALAAHLQGGYAAVHEALMAGTIDADAEAIIDFAVARGADAEAMRQAMDSDRVTQMLATNDELAEAIGLSGTPAFIVGDIPAPGAVSLETLRALVARARTGG